MNSLSRFIIFSVVLTSLLQAILFQQGSFAQEVYICVWRNPERTMTRIFKEAKDYRTVNKKISPEQLEIIEKRLRSKLLPGQREIFTYYEMLDSKGDVLGYIIAISQKGEYGAIEVVFGLDKEGKIKEGIYVQRSRERDSEFKKKEFLQQFYGKGLKDIEKMEIGKEIKAKKTTGTTAVLLGFKKELIAFDLLVKNIDQ